MYSNNIYVLVFNIYIRFSSESLMSYVCWLIVGSHWSYSIFHVCFFLFCHNFFIIYKNLKCICATMSMKELDDLLIISIEEHKPKHWIIYSWLYTSLFQLPIFLCCVGMSSQKNSKGEIHYSVGWYSGVNIWFGLSSYGDIPPKILFSSCSSQYMVGEKCKEAWRGAEICEIVE